MYNRYTDIQGFQPWFASTQTVSNDQPVINVLEGKNYRFVNEALTSGWGNSLLSPTAVGAISLTVPIGDRLIVISCGGAVNEVIEHSGDKPECSPLKHLFSFDTRDVPPHPWQYLEYGCYYFFVNPCVKDGIVRYDVMTDTWSVIDTEKEMGFSPPIYSIAEHDARVWILTQDTIEASSPNPPTDGGHGLPDFAGDEGVSDFHKGAFFISTGVAEKGSPYGLYTAFDSLFVFLSTGIITLYKPFAKAYAAEAMQAPYMVRWEHKNVSAYNPWCVVQEDKQRVIFLGQKGFYEIGDNRSLKEIHKPFSHWVTSQEKYRLMITDNNSIMLWASPYTDEYFISFKDDKEFYYTSMVYNHILQKWYTFDQPHYGFLITDDKAKEFGFIGADSKIRYFDNSNRNVLSEENCVVKYEPLDSFVHLGLINALGRRHYHDRQIVADNIFIETSNIANTLDKRYTPNTNYNDTYKNKVDFKAFLYSSEDGVTLHTDAYQPCIPIRVNPNNIVFDVNVSGYNLILLIETPHTTSYYSIKNLTINYVYGSKR